MRFITAELEDNARRTRAATTGLDLLRLSRERKLAATGDPHEGCAKIRIALLSAYTARPFADFLEQHLFALGYCAEVLVGQYDGYMSELLDPASPVHAQRPDFVIVVPSGRRCHYAGGLLDPIERVREQAVETAGELLRACERFHSRTPAEIILANFRPSSELALGGTRIRSAASDWNFARMVNAELGQRSPSYVRVCDFEFLAYRLGSLRSDDARAWYRAKQPGSVGFQIHAAAECARLVHGARRPSKKVLALDLDNTLWGGVLAEVGLDGIDLGDTTPEGEAFKAFQRYVLTLAERGVLLAIASKNREETVRQAFAKHPEMVLREDHITSWRVNWGSKADSLAQIADELNLGLDSFVFVDDNPAEIAIVNQFAPEVETVLLTADPADSVRLLDERRFFEVDAVTVEDTRRATQYRAEAGRRAASAGITDMDQYLDSLAMTMSIRPFCSEDAPRITQLINKSNQFNLTTRRRSQGDVEAIADARDARGFSVRLSDRFGDHGLISVVILRLERDALEIDTWLMSCRVLERQVEVEVLNEIVRTARAAGRTRVVGRYLPTPKNALVERLLPNLGFSPIEEAQGADSGGFVYGLDVVSYVERATKIRPAT